MYQPLADELRPTTLDDVYGQEEILGEGRMLRRMIESGRVPNLIFYGPSGTGKTTVANIIAAATQRTLYKLNATTASTADIREIVSQLDTLHGPERRPALPRRDPVVQQKAAAVPARAHRKRQDHAHRLHDGEPVFLYLQRHPQPLHGLRVQAASPPRPSEKAVRRAVRLYGRKGAARGHGGAGRARAHRKRPAAAISARRSTPSRPCSSSAKTGDTSAAYAVCERCEGRHAALGHAL